MNWQALKEYVIARLVERGTWLGLIALASLAGYAIQPEHVEAIVMVGTGVGGLLMVGFSDARPVNITVQPAITMQPVISVTADDPESFRKVTSSRPPVGTGL